MIQRNQSPDSPGRLTYLMRWARKKYKRLRGFKRLKAWWVRVTHQDPDLFAHWAWTHRFQPTGW